MYILERTDITNACVQQPVNMYILILNYYSDIERIQNSLYESVGHQMCTNGAIKSFSDSYRFFVRFVS